MHASALRRVSEPAPALAPKHAQQRHNHPTFRRRLPPSAPACAAAANLTANRLQASITGVQDLLGKRVGTWDDPGEWEGACAGGAQKGPRFASRFPLWRRGYLDAQGQSASSLPYPAPPYSK